MPLMPITNVAVEARIHGRTALVTVAGELDVATFPAVAEVLHQLDPRPSGIRHIVLDLRGVTFMDAIACQELVNQNDFARTNHHNFAVAGDSQAVRPLKLTHLDEQLVLVDDPADLAPPPSAH